jgi:Ca-activated chloride channel family protein
MPVTRSDSTVRSHASPGLLGARGGPGRHLALVGATVVLVLSAAVAVVLAQEPGRAIPAGCAQPPVTVTVATPSGLFPTMDRLAKAWTARHPEHGGRCLAATVIRKESNQVAAVLSPGWDPARDGTRPDVWVPESSLWLSVAAGRPEAASMLPPDPTSIASSPVVIALRTSVAQALGWPQQALNWQQVISAFVAPGGWAKLGHPEWANLRVGMVEPGGSTAGLAAVIAILDQSGTGTMTDAQLVASLGFTQALGAVVPDPAQFFTAQSDPRSTTAAFPALETDVADYDRTNPNQLVPVYPSNAPLVADYPYTILNASWVDSDVREATGEFVDYLRGNAGQDAFGVAGLRGPDRSVRDSAALPENLGFPATVPAPRDNPNAATLSGIITEWAALERQSNVLVALDTSGSMSLPVPGTNLTRLQLMQQAASAGFGLLTNQSNIALWEFSAPHAGAGEYRQLVPFGPSTANFGPVTRQQAMLAAVQGLHANSDTPLYDTIYAAFKEMQRHWQPNSTNAVLLITDGNDDLPEGGGLTLNQLLSRLTSEQQGDRPIQVISIAVGPEADAGALQQISQATGGRTFVAKDPAAAVQTLVLAFAGRLS